jgi:molybdopterin molybdotransferase
MFLSICCPGPGEIKQKETYFENNPGTLSKTFQKPAGLTHFLKGRYDGQTATPLDAQESFRFSSFARANCLIQINEEVTSCAEGELVDVYLLPG